VAKLVITPQGIRAIYDDGLSDLLSRAIQPEQRVDVVALRTLIMPVLNSDTGALWEVDLRTVGGPVTQRDEAGRPFVRYAQAIEFERAWLTGNWLYPETAIT